MQHIPPLGANAGAPLQVQHRQPGTLRAVLNNLARMRLPNQKTRAEIGVILLTLGTAGTISGSGLNATAVMYLGWIIYMRNFRHLTLPPALIRSLLAGSFV
jgi:hypothetical protein